MPSIYTCSECGRKVNGIKYELDGKSYCYDCYQQIYQSKLIIESQKQELYQYIYNLFQVTDLPLEIINGLDRLIKNGKKVKAMQVTLQYYYGVENHSPTQINNIVYVIENNYEAAKAYVNNLNKIKEHNKEIDINVPPVVVKISPTVTKKTPHNKRVLTKIENL